METVENVLFDTRINRCKKHNLESIVLIVICATLKRVHGYQQISEFAKKHSKVLGNYIDLSNGCPSTVTLWRNFERIHIQGIIDYIDLKKDFLKELANIYLKDEASDIAFKNSKTDNQSNLEIIRSHIDNNYINIVEHGKPNQTLYGKQKSFNNILERLATKNTIVAVGSNFNRPQTAQLIKKDHGDYLLEINKSNTYLFEQIKDQLDRHIKVVDKKEEWHLFRDGSSIKMRRCHYLENQIKWIEGIEKWPQVKCLIAIEDKYSNGVKKIHSNKYYLCSVKQLPRKQLFKLTEYHFFKSFSWIISFKINSTSEIHNPQKILKSNLMWIQKENFEINVLSNSE